MDPKVDIYYRKIMNHGLNFITLLSLNNFYFIVDEITNEGRIASFKIQIIGGAKPFQVSSKLCL